MPSSPLHDTAALVIGAHADGISAFLLLSEQRALACSSRLLRALCMPAHSDLSPASCAAPGRVIPSSFDAAVAALHAWLVRNSRHTFGRQPASPHKQSSSSQRQRRRQRHGGRHDSRPTIPSAAQLSIVLRDLALVARGLRVSCLVDCCALAPAVAASLLHALTLPEWRSLLLPIGSCSSSSIVALLLADNVFFVDAHAFVQRKCSDVASQLQTVAVVNVSAHLQRPELVLPTLSSQVSSVPAAETARVAVLQSAVASICRPLVEWLIATSWPTHSSSASSRVIELTDVGGVSSPAVAGLVLCYPVVYDLFDPHDDAAANVSSSSEDAAWHSHANCLSMTPLYVLQTSVTYVSKASSTAAAAASTSVLLEFSIPQCVVAQHAVASSASTALSPAERPSLLLPSLAMLKAASKCDLKQALRREALAVATTGDDAMRPSLLQTVASNVHVTLQMLDRVAL